MGRRGPPKTPKKLLENRGSWLAPARSDTVEADEGVPVKPGWMGKYAKHAWNQLIPKLKDMGILTKMDGDALTNYCVLWGRWRLAEEFLEENGHMCVIEKILNEDTEDEKTVVLVVKAYPEVKIAATLAAQLLRIQNNFGLTPSARSNIILPEKPKEKSGSAKYISKMA